MASVPGSFQDSPTPTFRLQRPPLPRVKRPKQEIEDQNLSPTTANPPLSTRYIDMLLELDEISTIYNLLANLFTWLLLAGYMVLPGAFTSIRNSRTLSDSAGKAGKVVVKAAQNIPLLWIGAFCCILGASGMCWLGWLWEHNYVWLVNRILLPGLLHSGAGLITTLVNIYTARSGFWSVTAIVTAAVTGSCTTIMIILLVVYDVWGLTQIKKEHQRLKDEAKQRLSLRMPQEHSLRASTKDKTDARL